MARLKPEIRRRVIVDAAVELSKSQESVHTWTREDVAQSCKIDTSVETVKHYFPAIDDLRKEAGEHPDTKSCVNVFREK